MKNNVVSTEKVKDIPKEYRWGDVEIFLLEYLASGSLVSKVVLSQNSPEKVNSKYMSIWSAIKRNSFPLKVTKRGNSIFLERSQSKKEAKVAFSLDNKEGGKRHGN